MVGWLVASEMDTDRNRHRRGGTLALLMVLFVTAGCLGSPIQTGVTGTATVSTPTDTAVSTTSTSSQPSVEPTGPTTVQPPFDPATAPQRLDATTDWERLTDTHRAIVRNGSGASFVYAESSRDGPVSASTSYTLGLKFAQTTDVASGTMFRKNTYGPGSPIETFGYYNEPGILHGHAIHHAGGKTYEDIEHVPVEEESSAELATATDRWAWDGRVVFDAIDEVTWEYVMHESQDDGQQVAIYEASGTSIDKHDVVDGRLHITDAGVVTSVVIVLSDLNAEQVERTEFSLSLGSQDVPRPQWADGEEGRHVIDSTDE